MTTAQGGTRLSLPDKPLPKPTTPEEWAVVYQYLSQPLPPEWVSFRADSKPSKRRNGGSGEFVRVVGYIDRTAAIMLLNTVCGPGNWSFRFKPLSLDPKGEILCGLGRLQLWDTAIHEDVGSSSNQDPSKGCLSDAFKRVCTQVGIALYLSNLPGALFCDIERWGDGAYDWKLSDAGLKKHYAILAVWDGKPDTWGRTRPAATASMPVTHDEDSGTAGEVVPDFSPPSDPPTARPAPRPAPTPAPSPGARAATPAPATSTPATPAAQESGQDGGSKVGQPGYIQAQQLQAINKLSDALGTPPPEGLETMTYEDAKTTITRLSSEYQQKRRAS